SSAAVSFGRAGRQMGLFISRWSELADEAAGRAQTRAHAGRLRSEAGRHAASAGVSAHFGRKPGELGRTLARSVPAWIKRPALTAGHHRRLPWLSSGHSGSLSAGAASTLLGT